ncbi:hypothetical protein MD484_g5472, partial [Candolleomyces efflorescens]
MEFFNGAQNFSMGDVKFNNVQGDFHDHSNRNVRNTYGDRNKYYTNNQNRHYNNTNNYNGDYHAPATHYHGPVNEVGKAKNVVSGGFVNEQDMRNFNEYAPHPDAPYPPSGPPPAQDNRPDPGPYGPAQQPAHQRQDFGQRPNGPAKYYYGPVNEVQTAKNVVSGGFVNEGRMYDYNQIGRATSNPADRYPPTGDGRPGPRPHDQEFTTTQPAVPRQQGFQRRSGPPSPNLPHRPRSDDDVYQWDQEQQGPPSGFPPMGAQGYPQHPPQDLRYRPMPSAPSGPSQPQRQSPPQQQSGKPETWPGEHAYKQGMSQLKRDAPGSWNLSDDDRDDSDSSDDSDSDEEINGGAKRMEDPNRRNLGWNNRGQRGRPHRGKVGARLPADKGNAARDPAN